jgi:hypothetical protein
VVDFDQQTSDMPQIDGRFTHTLANALDDRRDTVVVDVVRRDHFEADLPIMLDVFEALLSC